MVHCLICPLDRKGCSGSLCDIPKKKRKLFQDLDLLKKFDTFMCYPFRENVEVYLLQIFSAVSPEPAAVEDEIPGLSDHFGTYSQRN